MKTSIITVALCTILAAGFAAAAPPQAAQAEASFAPSSLALRTPVTGWTNAHLVIAGPEGFRVERTFLADETLAVDFSKLEDADGNRVEVPDGRFKWELTLTAPLPGAKLLLAGSESSSEAWVANGTFAVEHGTLVAPAEGRLKSLPTATVSEQSSPIGPVGALTTNPYGNHFAGNLTASAGVCAGCTDGDTDLLDGEVLVKHNEPWLTLRDLDHNSRWRWYSWNGNLFLQTSPLSGTPWTNPMTVESSSPNNTLYLDSSGSIGINTTTPGQELQVSVSNYTPAMRFVESGGGYADIYFGNSYWGFGTWPAGGSYTEPLRVFNGAPTESIKVQSSGDVVIGPFTNYAPFTVGYNTGVTNSLVAPMIVTTYSSGTPAAGFGAVTQWGLEAADGTMNTAADFGAIWENPSTKTAYLIFRAANNAAATEYMRIEGSSGYIGFGVANPAYPIHHSNGARLTTGGVWTDASSRSLKQDIETLDADAAMATFKELEPVTYAYKADPSEHHAGFIAEDVPDLVAANDRTGLAPMDVVAVLTKVVQEQQKTIETQQRAMESQQAQIAELRGLLEKLAASR
ncbi:MAG: tail fiber domain-containing protein [Acidobacteria bacterium]|nr:tail fiber domain-containing protein [Acidobacteriota bacterium]